MNCSYVSASSNLLKDPRIQVILRFFSVIAETLLTASQTLGDHLKKPYFCSKVLIHLDPWILEPLHPGLQAGSSGDDPYIFSLLIIFIIGHDTNNSGWQEIAHFPTPKKLYIAWFLIKQYSKSWREEFINRCRFVLRERFHLSKVASWSLEPKYFF